MIVTAERVRFKRPNSEEVEIGLMIGEFGRHIIVDNDMNIVINCSIEAYYNDKKEFNLKPAIID